MKMVNKCGGKLYLLLKMNVIYETIIDSPGSYLPYTIGYLEICRIRDTFQKAAGKYYSPLLFHTFLLDTGPTSFPVLERQINGWLKEKT